jgi:O-antigen/teichoic acid export membrane protein
MPAEWVGLRHPIGVVLLVFVVMFPFRIFGAVLHGLQDLAFLGRIGIISYLLSTAFTVALILAGWGLYALAVGWAVLQLMGAITGGYRLHRHFPTVLPRSLPRMPWQTARKRLGQGFWVGLNQIAQVLLNGTDILIIGKLFGPAAVVPFVITGKLIGVLSNQPQMLMAAAGPALSQMRMGEPRERLSEVCIALSQAMLLLSGAVVCVVLVVNQGFVGRWVGSGQYGGFWLTVLILVSMLLRHWNLTVGYALFCFGYERRLCLTTLLDGLLSVGAVVLFVRQYGLIGAPLGMIVGACLVSLPANLSALARETDMSVIKLMQPLLPWFLRFVGLVFGAGAVAKVWTPNTLALLVLTASVSSLIYLGVMFPLALRYPLGIYVRPRLFPLAARMMRALRLRALV